MGTSLLRHAATTAIVLASSIIPLTANAQVILRGVLYDDVTGAPVKGTVMLVDPGSDAAVAHAATDSLGWFDLKAAGGVYQIAAVREGYKSVLSAPVTFKSGERLTIRVPIAVSGDPEHRIGVVEHVRPGEAPRAQEAAQRPTATSGFDARRMTGAGLHFDRERLEKSNFNTLGEFLQSVPGMSVREPTSTSSMQMTRSLTSMTSNTRSSSAATCRVGWFIDGHRMDIPGRTDPATESLGSLQLSTVEAVEVFRGLSEMPAEFAAPDLRCGAIAVWTRRG